MLSWSKGPDRVSDIGGVSVLRAAATRFTRRRTASTQASGSGAWNHILYNEIPDSISRDPRAITTSKGGSSFVTG